LIAKLAPTVELELVSRFGDSELLISRRVSEEQTPPRTTLDYVLRFHFSTDQFVS